MRSPLASPFRGGFRNLTPMRARGRGSVPWSPVALAPYAWYDVHAGGTSTTIADKSGNGRADATYGATTAAPAYLPFTGTAYLHLEAATSGTNSLSCTAPANTASYAAYPLGGGAATTGAASAGAFTFTTAGDWTQLDLLNGSGTVLASFRASDSGQTGHTDAYSVAWTVNRGTAGRKSCLVNTRSLALFGTNDLIDVPSAAVPAMTASDSFCWLAVARLWATQPANGDVFGKHAGFSGATNPGMGIGTRATTTVGVRAKDGTNQTIVEAGTFTAGQRLIIAANVSTTTITPYMNNAAGTATSRTAVDMTNATGPLIGKTGSVFVDMEFEAVLTFNRVLTAGEIAQVVSYYRGGS